MTFFTIICLEVYLSGGEYRMTPEQKAREIIDRKLAQSGWIVQDMKQLNLFAGLGVAVREFPTSTGPVDYALFVEGTPVGIIEAKKMMPVKILPP